MKKFNYIYVATALLLGGCAANDMPEPVPDSGNDYIWVSGGSPDVHSTTRDGDEEEVPDEAHEPNIPGVCYANNLNVYWYETTTGYTDLTSPAKDSEFTKVTTWEGISLRQTTTQERSINKFAAQKKDSYKPAGHTRAHVGVTGLAFTSTDLDNCFLIADDNKRTGQWIGLKSIGGNYRVPEFYFGPLKFRVGDLVYSDNGDSNDPDNLNGTWFYRNTKTDGNTSTYSNVPITGKIYRIPSQTNVTFTDIPEFARVEGEATITESMVSRLELRVDKLPAELKLYGTHGKYYPVTAAKTDAECITAEGDVIVATTTDFVNGEATLSTFMLPSEVSYCMWVKAYINPNFDVESLKNEAQEHIYNQIKTEGSEKYFRMDLYLAPEVTLPKYCSQVYNVSNPEMKNDAGLLRVYLNNTPGVPGRFFSYSNIKINLKGRFAFGKPADLAIDVEPFFEKVHTIPLK